LLRGQNQLRLLAKLLLEPRRRFTVTELAGETSVPQSSVSRELAGLLHSGVIIADEDRGRRLVQANINSPIFPELASLLLKTAGPQIVLERLLGGVSGVTEAFIYGSWARRYGGQAGPEPSDVDLMIIGEPDVSEVRRLAEQASAELGRDVNATVLMPAEWDATASGFLQQIRSSPTVKLDLQMLA
jgi:predicted nucleotidyltransferase